MDREEEDGGRRKGRRNGTEARGRGQVVERSVRLVPKQVDGLRGKLGGRAIQP